MEENKLTILAVDDISTNLDILTDVLGTRYNVAVALDGASALEYLDTELPDLILLDVMMPGMDGYEVCRRVKSNKHSSSIPIIFLTAKNQPGDIIKAFELGAVDYVSKPFNPQELVARVNAHLDLKTAIDIIDGKNREQKELLHILCHDLANPFASILSVLNIAEDDYTLVADYVELLQTATKNGLEVIELVRKMRAVEEKPFELENIDLSDALGESISLLENRIIEKAIDVNVQISEKIFVRAERTSLINSVLNNILTNAIKFSQAGGKIDITTGLRDGTIDLMISDHGIGMPPTLVFDLFDISKATSRPGTSGESGTGFGMPLIRKFMIAYEGAINVSSKDLDEFPTDSGTTITLTFKRI
jgi:two-component system, sensor histidine kinase and response regulator